MAVTVVSFPLDHIHTPDDGRGYARDVFVNGRKVEGVFYADTRRGIARAYRQPLQLDRWKKRALSYTIRGDVVVVPQDMRVV